ncbi:hypothetical protein LKL35_29600 [Streptomyces sp. ET3-23]|uniref:SCO4983 family protein n=1 Tax=Streptomyces sp. ET3-23 TaxID=2885643 RepID=UPI001D12A263|nr:hypothetical protein [Streptomyces sp. ET3-23]MCC2279553.1 hypothetical protein [Streptomyces sp. ET3-23]
MYEPIRTKSVHTHGPHRRYRSRSEELDARLAWHLTALLTVTDEIRTVAPAAELDEAGCRLARQVERLRGSAPLRAVPTMAGATPVAALHQRAHMLAGQALVVATSRGDEAAAALAAERMRAHAP